MRFSAFFIYLCGIKDRERMTRQKRYTMKKLKFLFITLCVLCFAACDDDPAFSFDDESGSVVLIDAEAGATATVSFNSTDAWQARVDGDWLSVSPGSGTAGDCEVTLAVGKPNDTGAERTATLTFTSGSLTRSLTVSQEEYIRLEASEIEIPADGGDFEIYFYTTISDGEFNVYSAGEAWILEQGQTRAAEETGYYLPLQATANTGNQTRTATFYFVKEPFDNAHADRYILATATVTQAGAMTGESSDYSADGTVRAICSHSEGNGIPIVLMGDGFIDTEIAEGYYDEVMDKAVENLFSEEPMASLKPYFDIYAVTAVSKNNSFGSRYETAFSCVMEGGSSTLVEGDDEAVLTYVQAVEDIDVSETLAVVILNSSAYAGTTYFGYSFVGSDDLLEFAIAYCPVIYDLSSESFRQVLVHEAVGHGFAKLLDEYSYESNGTVPAEEIESVRYLQGLGWAQNVDFTSDAEEVLWVAFLADGRYDGQGLGVYEGADTYMYGIYRPTEDSMMNTNTLGFNAPSRFSIYTRVMESGKAYTPGYEEFASFDQQTYVPMSADAVSATRSAATATKPFARPRFAGKQLPAD